MTPQHRLRIAQHRSALAAIGVGAAAVMGLLGLLGQHMPGQVGVPTTQASPPRMTLGETETEEPPPSMPPTASATPPVKALPAPGTIPGV